MRLIDAETLKSDLRQYFPEDSLNGIEPKTLFAQILHDIDNAPTIVVRTKIKFEERNNENGKLQRRKS